jgi:hypothetical protein
MNDSLVTPVFLFGSFVWNLLISASGCFVLIRGFRMLAVTSERLYPLAAIHGARISRLQ